MHNEREESVWAVKKKLAATAIADHQIPVVIE